MGRYATVDDVAVADVDVLVDASDLGDLFATAARALAELTVEPATLGRPAEAHVQLRAEALDLLLFDWLAELILRRDRDGDVFPTAVVRVTGEGGWTLDASLRGGALDPGRTTRHADPKAVTFHRLRVERLGDGWQAEFVLDI